MTTTSALPDTHPLKAPVQSAADEDCPVRPVQA